MDSSIGTVQHFSLLPLSFQIESGPQLLASQGTIFSSSTVGQNHQHTPPYQTLFQSHLGNFPLIYVLFMVTTIYHSGADVGE